MISSMSRFEVVGPRNSLWETLDAIQDSGYCHLEPAPLKIEGTDTRLSRPALSAEDQAFRAAASDLSPQYEEAAGSFPASAFADREIIAATTAKYAQKDRTEILLQAQVRIAEWQRLSIRAENLKEDQELFGRYRKILDGLDSLRIRPNSVVIPLVTEMGKAERAQLVAELSSLTKSQIEYANKALGGGSTMLALSVDAKSEAEVRERLWELKISEVVFPQEYSDLSPLKIRDRVEERLQELPRELEEVEAKKASQIENHGVEIIALGHFLADSVARIEAYTTAAVTDFAFVLRGWAPMDKVAEVQNTVLADSESGVEFQRIPIGHDVPPTHLENVGFASPFESLLGIFPPPKAGGVDPTLVMVFTFPLFFGYMVGDAGYGFCMLLLAILMRVKFSAKYPIVKDISYVFGLGALSSIFFGMMFGEIFGHFGVYAMTKSPLIAKLGHAVGLHTEGLNPADPWHGHVHIWIGRTNEYLPTYLGYSLFLGLLHMSLSLAMGIYQAVGHYSDAREHGDDEHADHGMRHALEKFGMLLCLYGFVALALGGMVPSLSFLGEMLPLSTSALFNVGAGMVVLGMVIITFALTGWQRVTGPIEGVTVLANTISYSRLMAVGLAGVVLAGIANDFGKLGFVEGASIFRMIFFVAGAVLLHIGCLLIAIFDPLIQALRLHYVEFFSKFYEPVGVPYAPLARKGGSI